MSVELRERRERGADEALVERLEAMWAASPDARVPASRPRRPPLGYAVLARGLAWGWVSVLVAVFALAPAPAPGATYAGWVVGASVAILLGPAVAGLLAMSGLARSALSLAAGLGGLGIAVGIACRATAHHTGAWWLAETAMFATLTALALACLALRTRS